MNPDSQSSLAHKFGHPGVAMLAAAGAVLLGAVAWFVAADESAPPIVDAPPLSAPSVSPQSKVAPQPAIPAREPVQPTTEAPNPNGPDAAPKPVVDSPPSLRALEERYRTARSTEARRELVEQIAGWNSVDAVQTVARLFAQERHPELKLALLTGLSDINPALAPEVRLGVLTAALDREARSVRSAALGALAQLEDPRATAQLLRSKSSDPDKAVRDLAAALYQDRVQDPTERE